ncbi:response regulator transcription factor [Azohydromonas caseinilytica]|uniref:Response regulator transcription factor n=1 Tax=Azohydromonas caseinilytica TaxID=2728836 RepID=A0A848FFY6_9BURK|nr:response regulator transcription factor [Azohydromonas caseinilytica]NML17755.1 response regulator transcription factor [Azohydromonas caseinilytica]
MRLLLAEDDALLADALSTQLRQAGFEVEHVENGAVAEYLLLRQSFDLAILDLGLPMLDGLSVLKRVHAAKPGFPILVLTALDDLESRVTTLNAGADDYLTKPFDFPELEARLRVLLRRAQTAQPAHGGGASSSTLGRLVLEPQARRASVAGEALELSPREWTLLELLSTQRDQVVTKEQINQAWSGEGDAAGAAGAGGGNSIEVYIHRLRRKLEGSGLSIRTVRGLGYLLETGDAARG